jgi:hypothetical protein
MISDDDYRALLGRSTGRSPAGIIFSMAPSSSRVRKLLAEAAELPEEERVELAHELLRLIPADECEGEWLEEITWRAERVLRGESNGRVVEDAELADIFYGEKRPTT